MVPTGDPRQETEVVGFGHTGSQLPGRPVEETSFLIFSGTLGLWYLGEPDHSFGASDMYSVDADTRVARRLLLGSSATDSIKAMCLPEYAVPSLRTRFEIVVPAEPIAEQWFGAKDNMLLIF
jgi:hypothetical protein